MTDLPDLSGLRRCLLPDVLPPEVYSNLSIYVRQELFRMLGGETLEEWWTRPLVAREILKRLENRVEGLIMEDFP